LNILGPQAWKWSYLSWGVLFRFFCLPEYFEFEFEFKLIQWWLNFLLIILMKLIIIEVIR
jgi:hypothetical protein